MPDDILTPFQAAFLSRFFATDVSRRFFLTGGTALAAFHLHHRLSKDLDLFTLDNDALDDVDRIISDIVQDLGATIDRARRVEHFRQFHLVRAGDEPGQSLQVNKLTILPEMRKPIDLAAVQSFFTALANGMIDRLNPEQGIYRP